MHLLQSGIRIAKNSSICFSLFKNRKFLSTISNIRSRYNSNFSVDEISIPIPSINGHIAGKLWQGPKSSTNEQPTPIICIHGTQDNCGSFDALIPLIIKDDMKIFAFDLPGHGLSYHTKDLYYHFFLDGMTSIRRTLEHFEWKKATLLGHSLGSIISFVYSATFPEHVHKYIALDNVRPVPGSDPTRPFNMIINKIFDVEKKLGSGVDRPSYTYDQILKMTIEGRKRSVTEEGCKILLKRGAARIVGTDRYQFTHDIRTSIPVPFRVMSDEQTVTIAKNIKCPVCVIKGEPGEDYEPRVNFLKIVDIIQQHSERLEFHLVPGTHHFHLNEPHLVAPIINKFLDS